MRTPPSTRLITQDAVGLCETPPASDTDGTWKKAPEISASQFKPSLEHKWLQLVRSGLAYQGGAKHEGKELTVSQFNMHFAQNATSVQEGRVQAEAVLAVDRSSTNVNAMDEFNAALVDLRAASFEPSPNAISDLTEADAIVTAIQYSLIRWTFETLCVDDAVFGADQVLEKNAPFDKEKNMKLYKAQGLKPPTMEALERDGAIRKPQAIVKDPTQIVARIDKVEDGSTGWVWSKTACKVFMTINTGTDCGIENNKPYVLEWTDNSPKMHRTVVNESKAEKDSSDNTKFTMILGGIKPTDVKLHSDAVVRGMGGRFQPDVLQITVLAQPIKWDAHVVDLFNNTVSDAVTKGTADWCTTASGSNKWTIPYAVSKWREVLDAECESVEIQKWRKATPEGKPAGNKYDQKGDTAETRIRLLELAAKELPDNRESIFLDFTGQMELASASFSHTAKNALTSLFHAIKTLDDFTKCMPQALPKDNSVLSAASIVKITEYKYVKDKSAVKPDLVDELARVRNLLQSAVLYNSGGGYMFEGADTLMAVVHTANLVFPTHVMDPISYDALEDQLVEYADRGKFKDPFAWLMVLFGFDPERKQKYAYQYIESDYKSLYGPAALNFWQLKAKKNCGTNDFASMGQLYTYLQENQTKLEDMLEKGNPTWAPGWVESLNFWATDTDKVIKDAYIQLGIMEGSAAYAAARHATLVQALLKVVCYWDKMSLGALRGKHMFFQPDQSERGDDFDTLRQFLIDRYEELWKRGNWKQVWSRSDPGGNPDTYDKPAGAPGFEFGRMWPKEIKRLQELAAFYQNNIGFDDPEVAYVATMVMDSREDWDKLIPTPSKWASAALSAFASKARNVPSSSQLYAEAQGYVMMHDHSAGNIATSKQLNGITSWINAHGDHYKPGPDLDTARNGLVTKLKDQSETRAAQKAVAG